MKLKWYGHACFLIESNTGTLIVTDPYPPDQTGYKAVKESANLVIMSSPDDSFHCRADLIPGNPKVVDALALAQEKGHCIEHGIQIDAIETLEALDHPEHPPEANSMYRFVVDDIHIGHMGDVGNPLIPEQIEFFKSIDVLLTLTGGSPTIKLDDLKVALDQIKPKLIVPMHFRTLRYKPQTILWIESFLGYFEESQQDFTCNYEVLLSKDQLPNETRVLVLDYV